MNIYFAQAKEAFMFPKKETLSVEGRNAALDKYAEARDRADSHWGITKFFASLMPGIFKETAKDMADEKAWREMLKGAEFTDEDLHVSNAKNDEVKIIRQTDTGSEIVSVDLGQADILSSPYYYLKPNDVIYVEPLKIKQWGFSTFPYSTVISIVTLGITLFTLIKKK